MRKSVIILVLLGFSVQNPQRMEAGAFATEVTQLLNHAQLILQYIRQGTQLANELNMYADMLKNTRMLPAHTFGAIMNDVNALAAIVQGGQALAYSLGNLDQRFRQTYPTTLATERALSSISNGRKLILRTAWCGSSACRIESPYRWRHPFMATWANGYFARRIFATNIFLAASSCSSGIQSTARLTPLLRADMAGAETNRGRQSNLSMIHGGPQ